MRFSGRVCVFLLLSLLWVCCSPPSQTAVTDSRSGEVRLIPVTYAEWLAELETFRGEIVVVDFWATWCSPCIERFPHLVRMHEEYGSQGVTFVSMCLDDRNEVEAVEAARQFLKSQNARFPNYLMDETIVEAFEKLDLLGIPAVFIYDGSGSMRYRLTGDDPNNQFTEDDVADAIEELLRQQRPATE